MDKKLVELIDRKLYNWLNENTPKSKKAWAKLLVDVKGLPRK